MVAGAHGTNIRGGRERAGKIFKFFRFFERERQRNRAREREILLSKKPLAFYEIGSSIFVAICDAQFQLFFVCVWGGAHLSMC